MKKAFITGVTGQDGSYLAELLLSKGYEVHGLIRRSSTFNTSRIDHIYVDPHSPGARFFLYYGDLLDPSQITNMIINIQPSEIYNLGAQSHVRVSFDLPEYTMDVTGIGPARILEAVKDNKLKTRFYQASSSEMFGNSRAPQNEQTPFRPRSPYAVAKTCAYWSTVNYREGYDIFTCNGILFNHESPRRGETFVTRKISMAVAKIASGSGGRLYLGNLDAMRDWGYAPEYVESMWKMLQNDEPGDYVIGTGESHTVREFVEEAFKYAGLEWSDHVEQDKRYYRPNEVELLTADASKAKRELGWDPAVRFKDLVKVMVDADVRALGGEPAGEGDDVIRKKFPERWWGRD
ncbi:MAG: GDP-mannose 4,6-dehydratase [Candidatus Altiarchaeota archaeon]